MTMLKKVSLHELSVYPNTVPLCSANLKAYAEKDTYITENYDIQFYSKSIREVSVKSIVEEILKTESEIYGFSCYIWNFDLVKTITHAIRYSQPNAKIIWGGPQVSNQASIVLPADSEAVLICNSMGERTFYQFLLESLNANPCYENIDSISFRKDNEIITSDDGPQMLNLDEIPSPFLSGLIKKGAYTYSIYETNRGCPYTCAFCYWAGFKGKIAKYSEDRVHADIEWLCKNHMYVIHICDANWGLFDRDISFTEFIGKCKKKYNFPFMLHMSTALHKLNNRYEIAKLIKKYGLSTAHSLSLQSLNPACLEYVNRRSIGMKEIKDLQDRYNKMQISTYSELVWPLPGETLDSFKQGINDLSQIQVDFIAIYPCLLLPNTELARKRDEYGITIQRKEDGISAKEHVVSTRWVTKEEYIKGLYLIFCIAVLYNYRSLYCFMHFLNKKNILTYSELYSLFSGYMKNSDCKAYHIYENAIEEMAHSEYVTLGLVAYNVLKKERELFDQLIIYFVKSNNLLESDEAKLVFEVDLLNKPYLYLNDKIVVPNFKFSMISNIAIEKNTYLFSFDKKYIELVAQFVEKKEMRRTANERITVTHDIKNKMPFIPTASDGRKSDYCQGLLEHVRDIMPVWTFSCRVS